MWRALANADRRRIVDHLHAGPDTTGDIVAALGASRHVVMQHLTVLRRAGVVRTVPDGRHRINHLEVDALTLVAHWAPVAEASGQPAVPRPRRAKAPVEEPVDKPKTKAKKPKAKKAKRDKKDDAGAVDATPAPKSRSLLDRRVPNRERERRRTP